LAPRAHGFSLIELMVALVLGLIVVGSAVAMTVSIVQANAENVRYTRLSQELRAVSEIVARELRRARAVADPVTHVGRPDLDPGPYNFFDTSVADCAIYAYEGPATPHRVIRRVVTGGRGTIQLAKADVATDLDCTATGDILNSPQVDITDFCILNKEVATCADAVAADSPCTDLCFLKVTGTFFNDQSKNPIQPRTISTAIRIRSTPLPDAVP
jgi:prepilin-type N-terminal cleavage/methylation domain-containing protein